MYHSPRITIVDFPPHTHTHPCYRCPLIKVIDGELRRRKVDPQLYPNNAPTYNPSANNFATEDNKTMAAISRASATKGLFCEPRPAAAAGVGYTPPKWDDESTVRPPVPKAVKIKKKKAEKKGFFNGMMAKITTLKRHEGESFKFEDGCEYATYKPMDGLLAHVCMKPHIVDETEFAVFSGSFEASRFK